MEEFRVIIAGTRTFNNYELLKRKCDEILKDKIKTHKIIVVSGTAKGADTKGEEYAKERGFEIEKYPANWELGKKAGYLRNKQMSEVSNGCIVFWDGVSKGSKHMADIAKEKGLLLRVILY